MILFLISYEKFFEGETDIVTFLLENYNFTFHLRKPGASTKEYDKYLEAIPASLHNKIMLHDAYQLKDKYQVKGLHFSTKNRIYSKVYSSAIKSTSCHSAQEIGFTDGTFSYMFLGPVFNSISKEGYNSAFSSNELKNCLAYKCRSKVVAIGGICQENINELIQLGFDGVAVLGAVWGKEPENKNNIKQNFEEIYSCLHQNHIA